MSIFKSSSFTKDKYTKIWAHNDIKVELLKSFSSKEKGGGMIFSITENYDEIDLFKYKEVGVNDLYTREKIDRVGRSKTKFWWIKILADDPELRKWSTLVMIGIRP